MKINVKHIEVAKDIWDGELSQQEIVRKHSVSDRTIRRWQNDKDFGNFLDQMDESYRKVAKGIVIRHAQRAVKALVKLSETIAVKTEKGEQQRFKYPAETVCKSLNRFQTYVKSNPPRQMVLFRS